MQLNTAHRGGVALFFAVTNVVSIHMAPAMITRQDQNPPLYHPTSEPCTLDDTITKTLDLVLYGATGYTGRTAARYLAKGVLENPRWAIAGRSKIKLDYLHDVQLGNKKSDPKVIYIGLKNESRLLSMAKSAKVIINFAGPYEKYGGEALIRAALEGCAHYVDISTETQWNAMMLKKYGSMAEQKGVAMVQSAGFAAMASDFLAMSALNDAEIANQVLPANVHLVWTEFNDGNSGGQVETFKYIQSNHGAVLDAYILAPEIPRHFRVDEKTDGMQKYGFKENLNRTLQYFTFASHDCPVIRRSVYMKFKKPVSVHEAEDVDLPTKQAKFLTDPKMTKLEVPVRRNPVTGEGPPAWVQEKGSFAGKAIATGNGKKPVYVSLEGHASPSFVATAKMVVQMGLGLAFGGPDGHNGGYLTPSVALGLEVLEKRLLMVDNGNLFTITHGSNKDKKA